MRLARIRDEFVLLSKEKPLVNISLSSVLEFVRGLSSESMKKSIGHKLLAVQ